MMVLWCRHSSHLAHLEAEVEFWRMQFVHERQRAERAIDSLLQLKLPVAPITVPTPQEMAAASALISGPGDEEFDKIGDPT